MTYQNYEFTAFSEADFGVGDVNCGDTFTMPTSATACFNVSDNDAYLSGDCYDNSADHYGQHATIEGDNGEIGNGGQIYAESYFWVSDQHGNWYVMIEIEQEGSNEDYYTFYTGGGYTVPAEGAVLTVGNSCNVGQDNTWLDMKCLDAGDKAEPVGTGAICGRLTEDADCDNTEFADGGGYDEGLGGQTVELYGWNGSSSYLVTTTTTNADGSYDFPALDGGWYYVQFPEIDGGEFAAKDVGVEHADSDANAWGRTDWICLEDGQVQLNIDASVKFPVETGSISGSVWCDEDCDGVQGTTVVVEGCDYTIEAESMDLYGFHSVSGTQASDDCLVKLNCAGGWGDLTTTFGGKTGVYDVKIRVQDEDDGQSIIKLKIDGQFVEAIRLDADTDGGGSNNGGFSTYVIQDVSIASGQDIMLWVDGDGNEFVRIDKIDLEGKDEVVSEGEPTKAGVEIKLIDADGTVIETTHTDADGNYAFNDIPVGDYSIMGVAPDGTEFTIQDAGSDDSIDSDVNADGMSGTVTVTADGNVDVDLGVCEKPETGSIAGTYFCDENNNSVQDQGEAVLAGQTVWLIKAGSGVIKSTTTDANGNYIFEDLEAGDYTVRFDGNNNGGKEFVDGNVGGDDTVDSDVVMVGSANNGNTGTITLGAGENVTDVDAGVEDPGTAAIEGRVFCDDNNNDVDDAGDAAVPGVTVELLDGNGDPVLDGNGDAVTAVTDANGNYSFTGLDAGDYQVRFPTSVDGKTLVDANDPNNNGDDTNDSDADTGTGTTGTISVAIGETSSDNDAGVEDPANASLGGRIFMDSDNDDQDNNNGDEAPAPGVTVRLLDADGNELDTTVTDANGEYLFENLAAGDYKVDFPLEVDGKVLVGQNVGDDLSDSDASQTTGETGVVSVGISENVRDVDAGVEDPGTAAINGRVFMDNNDNSQDDAGDMGLGGIEVELLDADGNVVGNATTDGDGNYSFNGLGAGDYSVRFPTDVDGKILVEQNVGPDATDSDADQGTGQTGTISLEIGDVSNNNDAGVEDPAGSAIEGVVFMDNNDNSQNDAGDMPVSGVPVDLLDADGNIINSTVTGADGSYSFTGLTAGTYAVDFPTEVDGKVLVDANIGNDASDSDATQPNGTTGQIVLGINETSSNNDAGIEDPGTASIGNLVFLDNNGNGVFDAGDATVADVVVELLDANGVVIDDTTTNGSGEYLFDNLDAGVYSVRFTAPDGQEFTTEGAGADDATNNDSDADLVTGETDQVTLSIGEAERDVDAGLIVTDTGDAVIEGRVFMDNNDNSQDDNEMGVSGVPVQLLDADGNVIGNTTTGADGSYSFGGLDAGTYSVTFPTTTADGKVLVDSNVGPDETDSDADQGTGNTGPITVGIGETSSDNDAGVEDPGTASLAGKVFMDNNDNDQNDAGDMAIGGVAVQLLDVNGDVVGNTVTGADGSYEFTGLDAGSYSVRFPTDVDGKTLVGSNVGDDATDSDANTADGETPVVELGIGDRSENNDAGFEDPNGSAITGRVFMDNNDNSQDDAGDMGVAGVEVTLLDENGGVITTTTTGPNGGYSFTGLAAGTYSVTFPTEVDGKVLVDSNVGPDETDSDADQGTGNTGPITVGINETSENNDAGVEDPGTAAIGDRVFLDANGNGQQDDGEAGVSGVGVTVFDAAGNVAGTAITDVNGDYLVGGLDAGTYTVGFDEVDGFDFTTANSGNDASDSDADQTTGLTGGVTLAIGETNLTVDAGLVAENVDPTAGDDEGMVCATEAVSINVLVNDTDSDGGTPAIATVNGEVLNVGDSTTLDSGATVTLLAGGELSYDSATAVIGGVPAAEIVQGETATDSFSYTITDGQGGTDTGEVSVTLKGDMDTVETILSSAPTSGTVTFSGHSIGTAYTAELSGTGDARYDGLVIEAAYCIERGEDFFAGQSVTVDISGGLDSQQNAADFSSDVAGNLDLINWIINQDFTSQSNGDITGAGAGLNYTDAEIQAAIWGVTDGDTRLQGPETIGPFYNGNQANADEILALAQANGEGFTPGEGDLFTLVLNPTDSQAGIDESADFDQAFVVALAFDDYKEDCIC